MWQFIFDDSENVLFVQYMLNWPMHCVDVFKLWTADNEISAC